MTLRLHYVVEPQRNDRNGWQACAAHKAQRFAVKGLATWHKSGRKLSVSRTAGSFATHREAQATADRLNTPARRAKPSPTLGQALDPATRKASPVAKSLTRDEYNKLKGF